MADIWAQVYEQYESRFSIETNTLVESIIYDLSDRAYPYTLHTPRGKVKATKIVHATNGFAGHLLPPLRGLVYPLRGTMSVQKATPEFGQHGSSTTWSMVNEKTYDPEADTLEADTHSGHQNAVTGDIFIGGEKTKLKDLFVTDDTQVNVHCQESLATLLPRYFINGWKDGESKGGAHRPEMRRVDGNHGLHGGPSASGRTAAEERDAARTRRRRRVDRGRLQRLRLRHVAVLGVRQGVGQDGAEAGRV